MIYYNVETIPMNYVKCKQWIIGNRSTWPDHESLKTIVLLAMYLSCLTTLCNIPIIIIIIVALQLTMLLDIVTS